MIKSERGSVTLLVGVTVLLIIIILSSSLMLVSLKRKSQLQESKILQEIYGGDNLDEIYHEQLEKMNYSNLGSTSISASDITPDLYGKYVDYDIDLNENGITDDWKILYADDFNIYLIAADFINVKDCPTKDGVALSKDGRDSTISFSTDLLDKYSGSADITSPKIKNLNLDFFNTKKYKSEDYNMKAVAYMLDTDIWTKQLTGADSNYVDYVIGGPTIELFFNAYNAKYGTNLGAKAYSENSTYGYKISSDKSKDESSTTDWLYNISKLLSISDSTFCFPNTKRSPAMFMASTSAFDNANLMFVHYDGSISYCRYNQGPIGLRPVVCLKNGTGITWDSEKEAFRLTSSPQTSPRNYRVADGTMVRNSLTKGPVNSENLGTNYTTNTSKCTIDEDKGLFMDTTIASSYVWIYYDFVTSNGYSSSLNLNHIYYASIDVNVLQGNCLFSFTNCFHQNGGFGGINAYHITSSITNGYKKLSLYSKPKKNPEHQTYGSDYMDCLQVGLHNSIASSAYMRNILMLDLTEIFGEGNEPTQEWCDANINFDTTIVTK